VLVALSWLFIACAPEPEPEPDLDAAFASIEASLDEAGRLDVASQDEDARASWRRAHSEFEDVVEPRLRAVMPANDVAELELRFGLFRSALEARRGSSRLALRRLSQGLEQAHEALTPPPPEDVPASEPSSEPAAVRSPSDAG